ncbi:unnamed protein product, partial [Arctogadus glacialis]
YDIKGCELGRWTASAPQGSPVLSVMKDNNFQGQITLGPERSWFEEQVALDSAFLRSLNVLDYSLLIGQQALHLDELDQRHSLATLVNRTTKSLDLDEGPPTRPLLERQRSLDEEQDSGVPGGGGVPLGTLPGGGAEGEFHARHRRLLPDFQNAVHVLDGPRRRYFVGIIDVFTQYGWRKRLEHGYKALRFPGRSFSTVSPHAYSLRLCQLQPDRGAPWRLTVRLQSAAPPGGSPSDCSLQHQQTQQKQTSSRSMDFNMKKLAAGAGVFFTRAVQFTEERLGQAERTEPDADLERLAGRADVTRLWTERICRQTEVLLRPNPVDYTGVRMEEFLYEKLDRTAPQRPASGQLLGRHMEDAARALGPELAYGMCVGRSLLLVGACEQRLGRAEREFSQVSAVALIGPLRDFLDGDWSLITFQIRAPDRGAPWRLTVRLQSAAPPGGSPSDCSLQHQQTQQKQTSSRSMDFNMKKLASGAGVFFTRAVQFTEERLGQAERTEPDADLERLAGRADVTRLWTERICRQTEVLLRPNPVDYTGVRMEEFLYEKLDRTAPQRPASGQLLGRHMEDAARALGPELAYGRSLLLVGACEQRLGRAEREFSQVSAVALIGPLRDFLDGDWSLIT